MKRITVTVEPDDHALFEQMARNSGVTASWLIRRAMHEFIVRHERTKVVELDLAPVKQAR